MFIHKKIPTNFMARTWEASAGAAFMPRHSLFGQFGTVKLRTGSDAETGTGRLGAVHRAALSESIWAFDASMRSNSRLLSDSTAVRLCSIDASALVGFVGTLLSEC